MFRLPNSPLLAIARPEDILLPPRAWFVVLTLLLAFVLNRLPLSGMALALRPDFFALVLLYWCIHQPRWVGIGVAWLCGLCTDVAEANLFGQHALAYSLLGFSAEYFHRRVLRFPLWQQALHVLAILLATQLVVLVLRLMSGASPPSPAFLLSSVSSALLWPLASMLLQWPQRVRSVTD
ncbi:MAG: rod shape-determining protein MreD [Casimicrobiaceae bacterium]|nr:rod shape-determining protein MreD [Casimicrobiaceae bacterium]MCX8099205.1 rod shape-determining protein MreD [Casimicrobiaceae bacterium]MDW8311421.1 rod shape-determining protein MreD [Burkholderiales bacterium]